MGVDLGHIMKKAFVVPSYALLAIGNCGDILILRLYFLEGGKEKWLSTWLQSGGWPIILIALIISYLYRLKSEGPNAKPILMKVEMAVAAAILGVLSGLVNYLYSFGSSYLPASTMALIIAAQLAFTAIFAFLILKQKFTAYSISAVVLLTGGAAFLAVDASSDRPEGETEKLYILGFLVTCAATVYNGLFSPWMEWIFRRAKLGMSYTLTMEMELVVTLFANFVAIIGMLKTNAIQAIPSEAREFQLGEANYYVVLVLSAILGQCSLLGTLGVVLCSSSLQSGITTAVLLPVSEVLTVIIFHENFGFGKGISLGLCLVGFALHFYGEIKLSKSNSTVQEESQLLLHDDITERI